ncbi:hypothetical protein, partial [Pseudomonas aeruginosa]|uniref:hypothetical protein n=1 Tax=Pseudomonas aeruginosa TaxID=287 RepID=UPI001955DB25
MLLLQCKIIELKRRGTSGAGRTTASWDVRQGGYPPSAMVLPAMAGSASLFLLRQQALDQQHP